MNAVLAGCKIEAGVWGILTTSTITNITISENFIDSQGQGIGVGGAGVNRLMIRGNIIEAASHGMNIAGSAAFFEVTNNVVRQAGDKGIWMQGGQQGVLSGNVIEDPGEHGIHLDDMDEVVVVDNVISNPGTASANTYDGIFVDNDSDRNLIHHNQISPDIGGPGDTRYGINVNSSDCDCNAVVGNYLGDSTFYATAPLNDSGTGTWLTYPNDATWGDNFVDCETSP